MALGRQSHYLEPRLSSPAITQSHDAPASARSFPLGPLLLIAVFGCFMLLPRVRTNPTMMWTFAGAGGALLLWQAILWITAWRKRTFASAFPIDLVAPVKSHYIQASVQFGIYAYWGWYWREIYSQMPLIISQLVFLVVVDALLSWSRGRAWRPGFSAFPIVFSTNFFLWFRDDYFFAQFMMVAAGALAKEFIRWPASTGRKHIFNPSAFGLTLFSAILIMSGMTREWSWARELASTIDEPPHIYLVIFLLGLVVQYMFSVTLMTFAAAAMLCVLNLAFTEFTGVYHFITINISAAVFLGLHLLMTDPATSPKTLLGRLMFGGLYGIGIFVCFDILRAAGVPELYSKLLPVPILNLLTPLIDRATLRGMLGKLNAAWEGCMERRKLNLIHMTIWAALFFTMLGTGFVQAPHPGKSLAVWKQAVEEGKPFAGDSLVRVALTLSLEKNPAALNELGIICMEGTIEGVVQSNARAARYFSDGSEAGSLEASANVAIQFLFMHERRSDQDVVRALTQLELASKRGEDSIGKFAVGYAYETGKGRQRDWARAKEIYVDCGPDNLFAVKGLARLALMSPRATPQGELRQLATVMQKAAEAGDAEACWYLAYIYGNDGSRLGMPDQEAKDKGKQWMMRACKLAKDPGLDPACNAALGDVLPAYQNPVVMRPPWVSGVAARP